MPPRKTVKADEVTPEKEPEQLVRAHLFRENKGWVLVTPDSLPPAAMEQMREYWKKVSDLPLIVFADTELLVRTDGSIVVKEVAIAL